MINHIRYRQRTVEWGHWGITFMDIQNDLTKNYGNIIGTVFFPIGTRGPCDLNNRNKYNTMIDQWVNHGIVPEGLIN